MRLRPKGKKILVKLDPVKERQVGSIIVADDHREQARIGTVREIGTNVTQYEVGERILINCYIGIPIDLFDMPEADGESLRMVTEDEILAGVEI